MLIADNETAIDLLYYEAIAGTIVELLKTAGDEPLTVGVHGDWGAGKSSILMMLEKEFDDEERTLCIRFNGWLFQGLEDTKAVLIETIIEQLIRKRTLTAAAMDRASRLLKRVNWMKVARKMGGLAFTASTGIPTVDQVSDLIGAGKALVGKEGGLDAEDIDGFVTQAASFLKDAEAETVPTQIHAFREEFIDLLETADIDRLVVVVDDLDRCLPETAIETLEAIRLFLFVPGAAFVIAADEAMIEYAVKKHFPDLPLASGQTSYARNYLEKLIQVPFRLPPLGYVETRTYITLLFVSLTLKTDDEKFVKLLDLTKEVLRRPWGGGGLDREKIRTAIGSIPPNIENALQLADQIAPLLTDGARGNPRQIKRFLNTMTLRLAIAKQRGIESDIKITVLAKLMLAERFETNLFGKIEREATDGGESTTLETLETFVHGGDARTPDADNDAVKKKAAKAVQLKAVKPTATGDEDDGWVPNEWARRWARLAPKLTGHDLRPYLFISRDRKALFTATSKLALMEEWVEKLCSSRFGAIAVAREVAALSVSDAEQIFSAVALRVRSAENLLKKPDGIDGLIELCKVHKTLQGPVVSLIASLPPSKLGPWAAAGWDEALTEAGPRNDFEELRRGWAGQDDNKALKLGAVASSKKRG